MEKAVSLGRRAHAITDHGSISGHVLFEKAVKGLKNRGGIIHGGLIRGEAQDIKPIFGMEAYTGLRGEGQAKRHLSILAKNQTGYKNLLKVTTRSWEEGYYYRQTVDGEMLLDHREGLVILSGCEKGQFMAKIEQHDWDGARELARTWRSVFGDDFYIEIQHFPHVSEKASWAWAIAEELGIKTVLTCDAHYLEPDGWRYQQLLWSIRDGKPVDDFKIEYAYLWPPDELYAFVTRNAPWINWQQIFENTVEVGEKIERYDLPRAPHIRFPLEGDKIDYIRQRCLNFLQERNVYQSEYIDRLTHELDVIAGKGYEDYFLMVADMIGWAKQQGIFVGPARGSAAGSVVCWGLRITEIDPVKYGLLFERFVDPTRTDLPDIDCDFEDERRDEVFAYMARRWGATNVAKIATFSRLQGKSALDDAARSYRIPREDIDVIKRHLVERSSGDQRAELTIQDTLEEFPEAKEVYDRHPALHIAAGVEGKIRHIGKHAAGLIVTGEPVSEYTAVIGPPGSEKVIAVDWRDSQYLNLMKIDCLGLKEMTLLRLICGRIGWTVEDLYALPLDDPETFAGFNSHDFLGIFQFTGLATKGVASRISFENVVQVADVNALSRPGPLHAGATELYIRGKQAGSFQSILPQPEVQPIIRETYGQIIYQEQVMRILRDVGGMTWQDVCDIRSIMGKSKGSEAFNEYWPKWEEGTRTKGMSEADARQIWETIRLYGKHGFNKSHALAYGIVAYWSMYMKQHFPREFYWAQLVKSPNDGVAARFIMEAKRKGIQFAPFALDARSATWWIDDSGAIAPGWGVVRTIGEKVGEELALHAPYSSMDDMEKRVNKRIANASRRAAVEEALGSTVDDFYSLWQWELLAQRVPDRETIQDVNEGNAWSQNPVIAGKVIRINKKNRIEEYRDKGRDTSKLDPNGLNDYVILIVQDETDSTMVYVSPEMYAQYKQEIWTCEGTFIAAKGRKMAALQLLTAQQLAFVIIDAEAQPTSRPFSEKGNIVAKA